MYSHLRSDYQILTTSEKFAILQIERDRNEIILYLLASLLSIIIPATLIVGDVLDRQKCTHSNLLRYEAGVLADYQSINYSRCQFSQSD